MKVKFRVAPSGGQPGDVRDVSDAEGASLVRAGYAEEVGGDSDEEPTKAELYDRAGELEIEGRSKMDKDELKQAIAEAEE